MNIFILDDDDNRQQTLVSLLKDLLDEPNIFCAYSRDEAIKILENNKSFDMIFLDHDLGGRVYVDSSEYNTGWWVAKYIADNNIQCPQIILHTLNYAGAKNMLGLLKDAVYVPFTNLVKILNDCERNSFG